MDGYGIHHTDHALLMVPFCHGAGWGVPYSAFMCGADISILNGPIRADHVLSILCEERISVTATVPEVIAQKIDARDVNLAGLGYNGNAECRDYAALAARCR